MSPSKDQQLAVTHEVTQSGQTLPSDKSQVMPTNSEMLVLPVTVLSGFLGSGKTTLLKRILENRDNLRCAVIVNDMAAINIDARLIKDAQLVQTEVKMIEMTNGCICCNLREDLLVEITRLAKLQQFDYLIIESTGISEPHKVAETFTFEFQVEENGQKFSLSSFARLDTCVTVVDADNYFDMFEGHEILSEKFASENPPQMDDRTVAELMIDQIEFADIILVNKVDLVSKEHLENVKNSLKNFNKSAMIIETTFSNVDLKFIINTSLFDFEKAQMNKNWLSEDRYNVKSETVEFGITSFIYKNIIPFHDDRLFTLLKSNFFFVSNSAIPDKAVTTSETPVEEETDIDQAHAKFRSLRLESLSEKKSGVFHSLYRSKGYFFLASNGSQVWEWSQQGIILTSDLKGFFGSSLEEELVAQIPDSFKEKWDPIMGDRENSLVFIGKNLDEQSIRKKLDECLLTQQELKEFISNNYACHLIKSRFVPSQQTAVAVSEVEKAINQASSE